MLVKNIETVSHVTDHIQLLRAGEIAYRLVKFSCMLHKGTGMTRELLG